MICVVFTETDDFLGTVKEEVGALEPNARPRAYWFIGVNYGGSLSIGTLFAEVSLFIDDRVYQWRESFGQVVPGQMVGDLPGWKKARKDVDDLQRVLRDQGHILVQGRIRDIITKAV